MPRTKPLRAFWFAPADMKLGHGDGRPVVVGETLEVKGKIVPCKHGLHASIRAYDAFSFSASNIVCLVEVSGTIVHHDGNKVAAAKRKVLAILDAEKHLRLWGIWCAEQALNAERAAGREPDQRSWNAIEVARRYANGDSTKEELATARDAARDAARDSVRVSARDSVRVSASDAARAVASDIARVVAWASASDVTWVAASDAARAVAWASASDVAWVAASDAARAVAWDAARAVVIDRFNAELERILLDAMDMEQA